MKIFERDSKLNFVDDNNVLVGFDYSQCCCEHFGWYISPTLPSQMEPIPPGNEEELEDYNFDTEFFYPSDPIVVFRLVRNNVFPSAELYLVLYNVHNGYYSHGFEMNVGGENICGGYL